jgi:cytochrome c biogenesis protein CcdA
VLGGQDEIHAGLPTELARFRADPDRYQAEALVPFRQPHDTAGLRTERFATLRLSVVLAAGLIDGINPCAFTTVIFLISYLGVTGGSRRRMLVAGGLFTLGVLAAYFAIGLAFFQVASALMGQGPIAMAVHLVMLVALVALGVLSAVDAVRCLRGRPTEIALKLPRRLQEMVRARIRTFARSDRAGGAAAFSLGVVIAGLELACTGQIYLPIVTMIAEPRHRAEATLQLLIYNLAFIVPLCVVFLLAAFGVGSERLARFASRHVAAAKISLSLLFLGLALIVAHNLGWLA